MAFHSSETLTPRSSTSTKYESRSRALDEELRRDEAEIEAYGADDPHEPQPKDEAGIPASPPIDAVDSNKVVWDGPNDPENPQNWSEGRKWMLTVLCIVSTINVTFASSAPSVTGSYIIAEFHKETEVGYLVTTMFLCGYVFGPMFWGPGSELVGRQLVFRITLTCYTVLHLGQALAQNMETLLITRFLAGFFAVAPMTNCSGVIVDIWDPVRRGTATSLFTAGVFVGPVLGPLIGGFVVSSHLGWRWVYWVMLIFAGACTITVFLFLPETFAPILLQKKARRLRKEDPVGNANLYAEHERSDWSIKGIIHRTLYRPVQMLMMEPILVLVTVYLSLVYGILYCTFEAFPLIFVGVHGFTISQAGLIFIGIGIGSSIGSALNVPLSSHYPQLLKKWRGFPPPEQRLFGGMIGAPGLVISLFWLGWTGAYASVPWYVPAIATIFIGISISLIFISFLSHLADTYLMYAASAFAANTMCRSALAASFPLFTVQMFNKLGINWACTLLALLSLLLAPSPFLFYRYGPWIRAKSKFSPCLDLKVAKEIALEEAEAKAEFDSKNEKLSQEV